MFNSSVQENKWKGMVQTNQFRKLQSMTNIHDPIPMVQKLLDEEREAVRSALQAVDEHTRQKRKELAESHRRWMKENKPSGDENGSQSRQSTKQYGGHRKRVEQYEHYLTYSEKKRSVYLDVICEEDDEQIAVNNENNNNNNKIGVINNKDKLRLSSRNNDYIPALEEREVPMLPPIIEPQNYKPRKCCGGKFNKAKLNNWQNVAENFIDSDARKRTRLRVNGRNNQTQLHLNYQNDVTDKRRVDQELGLQKKRQYPNGPSYSSSNSRWISNIPSLGASPD